MNKKMIRIATFVVTSLGSAASFAVPLVGSSGGTFSSLSSCDNSGSSQDCRIVSSPSGANTRVEWGSTSSRSDFVDPSWLTAVDVNINANTDVLSLTIGQLNWYNSSTLASQTDANFNVNFNYFLDFSQPFGSADPNASETFGLNIYNSSNPPGDTIKGLTLAGLNPGLTLSLKGITVSNFRYEVVDNSNSCSGVDSEYSGATSTWYNCENNLAALLIKADFRTTPTSVPEPATFSLMGLGLVGAHLAFRRRRNAKTLFPLEQQ